MAIRVSPGVDVDPSNLIAHLQDFSKTLGRSLGDVVRDEAGLFCMDLARYTPPFTTPGKGLDGGAKARGMENVRRGVFKIFQPVAKMTKGQVTAQNSYDVFKLWTKENGEQTLGRSKMARWDTFKKKYPATNVVRMVGSDQGAMRRIHKQHRKYQGKGSLTDAAKRHKGPYAIASKEKDITNYIKNVQRSVGVLKSGYWWASQKIRAKDVRAPAWIKQQPGQRYSIGIPELQKVMLPTVTVGHTIGKRVMPAGLINAAIKYRMYAMRIKMAAELNKRKQPLWSATASGLTNNTSKFF